MKVLISAANAKALIDLAFENFKSLNPDADAKLLFQVLDVDNTYTVTVTFIAGEANECFTQSRTNDSKAVRAAQVWQDIVIRIMRDGLWSVIQSPEELTKLRG